MGSSRGRKQLGMAFAGVVLSIVVSAHETGDEGREGAAVVGRIAAETLVVENLGGFRNIARFLFLLAAVDDSSDAAGR